MNDGTTIGADGVPDTSEDDKLVAFSVRDLKEIAQAMLRIKHPRVEYYDDQLKMANETIGFQRTQAEYAISILLERCPEETLFGPVDLSRFGWSESY